MNRLQQDAADSLAACEQQAAFREAERARWVKAQPPVIVGAWAPVLTERQQKEFEQYAALHQLSF